MRSVRRLVIIAALVLQDTLFADLRVFDVSAELMMLLPVCAGVLAGPDRGAVVVLPDPRDGARVDRALQLPGDRAMVRERTTTVAMHLLRRLLRGEQSPI